MQRMPRTADPQLPSGMKTKEIESRLLLGWFAGDAFVENVGDLVIGRRKGAVGLMELDLGDVGARFGAI